MSALADYEFQENEMDDFDTSVPENAGKTIRRLWNSVSDQHGRLLVVIISVVFYTLLSVLAPLYSVHIVDLLWERIQTAFSEGMTFSVTWEDGGKR